VTSSRPTPRAWPGTAAGPANYAYSCLTTACMLRIVSTHLRTCLLMWHSPRKVRPSRKPVHFLRSHFCLAGVCEGNVPAPHITEDRHVLGVGHHAGEHAVVKQETLMQQEQQKEHDKCENCNQDIQRSNSLKAEVGS